MNSSEEHQKYIQSQHKKKNAEMSANMILPQVEQALNAPALTVPKSDVLRQPTKVLSPLIFIKRKYKTKQESRSSRRLVVLENMLSTVVQAYYKSDYEIEAVMRVLKSVPAETASDEAKVNGLPRRAAKKSNGNGMRSKGEVEDFKVDLTEANKFMDGNDVLDYLISPLKFDFEFGQLIRKLVTKRDSDI